MAFNGVELKRGFSQDTEIQCCSLIFVFFATAGCTKPFRSYGRRG